MNDTDTKKIEAMREGGKVLSATLAELLEFTRPGVTLLEIEALAQKRIKEAGMKPSFSTVADYKWATCLCVNDVIVHGIPTKYALVEGDILTIDIGLINKQYHTDTAWTKIVADATFTAEPEVLAFLESGKTALRRAIREARAGNRVGHISKIIQEVIERDGYGIAKSLVGHGVGKTLHEPPQIPGFLRGSVEKTAKLTEGMTIAIEVIYAMGSPALDYDEDGWSIRTQDGSLTAVFEQTLAVTDGDPFILTPEPV